MTISGRQMSVRNSLRELIEAKLAKFERFFGDDAEAYVTCSNKNNKQTVEVTIIYAGTVFRSEEQGSSFPNAVTRAVDALERQIRKNKTRLSRRLRDGAFAELEAMPEIEEIEEVEQTDKKEGRADKKKVINISVLGKFFKRNVCNTYFFHWIYPFHF